MKLLPKLPTFQPTRAKLASPSQIAQERRNPGALLARTPVAKN